MTLNLHRTVITLGLVSLFTDFSSEMIYPLLPVFLTTVLGAGAASLGVIEGVAETTAALGKSRYSDRENFLKRLETILPVRSWGRALATI